jgi:hypothetical protein
LALTAYAIKFMSDASEFITVDDSVIQESVTWVINQTQPDGHWVARDWNGNENPRRSILLTAYIARMLVNSKLSSADSNRDPQVSKSASADVRRALAYLQPQAESVDEPYVIASYALASLGAGDNSAFEKSTERLRKLEHREGGSSYWSLETNTPFYGWGMAGRLETTALVLQAFANSPKTDDADSLIGRGLLFLLRNQDRYGIWYSTQATINVLDAMGALTTRQNAGTIKPEARPRSPKRPLFLLTARRLLRLICQRAMF